MLGLQAFAREGSLVDATDEIRAACVSRNQGATSTEVQVRNQLSGLALIACAIHIRGNCRVGNHGLQLGIGQEADIDAAKIVGELVLKLHLISGSLGANTERERTEVGDLNGMAVEHEVVHGIKNGFHRHFDARLRHGSSLGCIRNNILVGDR